MTKLVWLLLQICGLQKGPQDLPFQKMLPWVLALGLLATMLVFQMRSDFTVLLIPLALLSIAVDYWLLLFLLRVTNKEKRLNQTLSALFGTQIVIGLITIPILWPVMDMLEAIAADPSFQPDGGLMLAAFCVAVWNLLVFGHIIRHAIDTTLGKGALIALGFSMMEFMIVAMVKTSIGTA